MSDDQPYSARTTVPHPAFAPFDEETRRRCAEAFVAVQDNPDRLKVEVDAVVDGRPVPTCMCPLAYCLFYSGAVQPILVRRSIWGRPLTHEITLAFLAKDVIFVDASMPDWHSVAVALDVVPMPEDHRLLFTVPDAYGTPIDLDIRSRIRRVPMLSVPRNAPGEEFSNFYIAWDRADISTFELVRDWLGIDAIDH